MNKQDNKLTLSVLATLTAAIVLIYTLIMYHDIIYAVIGTSLFFLITAFILTRNFITFSTMKNKSLNVQLKTYIDDISTQLETMGGAQSQIGKATYLYTKQAAQAVTTLENNYIESQEALYKNLASLSSAQIKTSKLILRNDQNNAIKITTSIKDMGSQLRDTMTQSFDRLQPAHPELATTLEEIVHYLKNQPDGTNQELLLQLDHIAQELQNIFNNIQQFPTQKAMQITTAATEPTAMVSVEETVFAADVIPTEEIPSMNDPAPADETSSMADIPPTEKMSSPEYSALTEEAGSTNKGANDMLSADEIAALFASSDPAPKKTSKPASILKTETDQSTTDNNSDNDSGKQMSADEIAALFAAAEPAPKKKTNSTKASGTEVNLEPAQTEPAATDLNKQLSAEEIAALFASMG